LGAQWTLKPLWIWCILKFSEGFCKLYVDDYDDGGVIPESFRGEYTYVMTAGGSQHLLLLVLIWKVSRGFDINKAYEGMRKNFWGGFFFFLNLGGFWD